MENEKFTAPQIEIIRFEAQDIITTSENPIEGEIV